MGAGRTVTSVVLKRNTGNAGTTEERLGVGQDLWQHDHGELLAADGGRTDNAVDTSLVGGARNHIRSEQVVTETQNVSELVGEGAEVQELVDRGRLQESQVQNVGSNYRSTVSSRHVARGGCGEIFGASVIFSIDGDEKICWELESRDVVVVAFSSTKSELGSKVDLEELCEVCSDSLDLSDRQLID